MVQQDRDKRKGFGPQTHKMGVVYEAHASFPYLPPVALREFL